MAASRCVIFYSWQTDLPNATNRGFIERALEQAAKAIRADESIQVEPVIERTRRVNHYLHTASCRIIDPLVEEGIGTLVIGLNRLWKQEVEFGRRNNQNFVQIPHSRLIDMLTYKVQRVGIRVSVREESYTSLASFLDGDTIHTYDPARNERLTFSGRRVARGLYRANNGRRLHADVNGSYNTLCKEFAYACSDSQARPGQEIGALQVRLAAWRGNVGSTRIPLSPLAV